MQNYLVLGQWNAICDICGFKYKSGQLKKNWRGLWVCEKDWEARNPQDFIKVREERIAPPWTRPRPPTEYVDVCYLWGESGYADWAVADCAVASNNTFTPEFLSDLEQQGPP